MNMSKMNGSRVQVLTSNFNNSKIHINTGSEKPVGIRESRKNMNSSQFKGGQNNKPSVENKLNMSKIKNK